MRIGILGAGAIGGTIAALLDRARHDVEVAARGVGLEAIRNGGIRLDGAWGEHTAAVAADAALTRTPELAFVCTKAQDALAAIAANDQWLRGIPVVIVQNGLDSLTIAADALPDSECIGALALYAANYTAPGRVTVTAAGGTFLGGGPSAASEHAAAVLGTAMPAVATENFVGCQWTKLIINEVNALPAITGLSVQQTVAHPGLRRIITAAMREAVRLGFEMGIRFGSLQGLDDRTLRWFARAPLGLAGILPRLMARRMGATPNLGSTLQSIRRGQRTEIDYLSGAVTIAATTHGRTAPVNAALVRLVHEVERTQKFFSPADVILEIRV